MLNPLTSMRGILKRAKTSPFIKTPRRAFRLESLEARQLLSVTPFDLDDLQLDTVSYEINSILVRFASEQAAESRGTALLPGAQLSDPLAFLPGLRQVTLPDLVTVEDALAIYLSDTSVLYAEPNYRMYLEEQVIPNDTSFSSTWGLHNTGQSGGTIDADIDAPEAWSITTGSSSVVVAVLDTGVDYTHPDLAANIWSNAGEIAGNGIDDDGNGYVDDIRGWDFVNNDNNPMDDHSHGTHVAGTIAAVGNNGIGVAGIAWNARIMPLKVGDASGSVNSGRVVAALDYAIRMGASVSNNSYGDVYSSALYDAIAAAGDAGHIYVASANNNGADNDVLPTNHPSSYDLPNIVAVAATDHNDNRPSWSNYGATTVDLGAPGASIYSTWLGGGYGNKSGTSMAAPHVTGTVALVQSVRPDWSYSQVISAILTTVDPVASMAGKTVSGGRLNAAGAVAAALPAAAEVYVNLDGVNLADGTGSVDFGTTLTGTPLSYTFTVKNLCLDPAADPLTLGSTITVPAGFTVVSGFGDTSLASGESTTFSVRLDATSPGTYSGQLSFTTTDSDESPYNFALTGTVVAWAPVVIDNWETGQSTTGSWWLWSGGLSGHSQTASASPSNKATWSFSLEPGRYRISATWPEESYWATNAPFAIKDGATTLGTIRVNQTLAPDDFNDEGVGWKILGEFDVTSGALSVTLSGDANLDVLADAIHVQKIASLGEDPIVYALRATPVSTSQSVELVLEAQQVYAPGTVERVEFYRGSELLGTDEDGSDGWAWIGSTAGWPQGEQTFYARAQDDAGAWSEMASTTAAFFNAIQGNDTIVFSTGLEHSLTINGLPYDFTLPKVELVHISGLGGNDRISIFGSAENETVTLRPGSADLLGQSYRFYAVGIETITVDAGTGTADTISLAGSGGSNRLYSYDSYTVLSDSINSFHHRAQGFDALTIDASAGDRNYAFFYDSPQNDVLDASPDQVILDRAVGTAGATSTTAIGFERVYVYATKGGSDSATLTGSSTAANRFYGYAAYSILTESAGSFYFYANGFDTLSANSPSGGYTYAYLYDSPGNDTLDAWPGLVTMNRADGWSDTTATGFRRAYSYANSGGVDTANLHDSDGNDTFFGRRDYGYMSDSAATYYHYIKYFDFVYAHSDDDSSQTDRINVDTSLVYQFIRMGTWR